MVNHGMSSVLRAVATRLRTGGLRGLARSTVGRLRRRPTGTSWPQFDQREIEALAEVLKSRKWGGHPYPGKYGERFARAFAKMHDAKYGICCNSGTTALFVALRALEIGPGDEVIVPALTFAATASAVLEVGATPVFVDIDEETWCIDHRLIPNKITSRTKALIPVHLGHRMADMDEINQLARGHGFKVIEDAAHMHGGKWRGRGAGSIGDLGCFSFQNGKTMTAGEGGIILTSDGELAARCEAYVNLGRVPEGDEPQRILGMNLRLTELQAAILMVQLTRFPEQMEIRARNYSLLDELLLGIEGVAPLRRDERMTGYSGYGYYFKYLPALCGGVPRARFLIDLEASGFAATSGWRPVYHSAEFGWRDAFVQSDFSRVSCPVAERAAYEQAVWMPHPQFLAHGNEIRRLGEVVGSLVESYRNKGSMERTPRVAGRREAEGSLHGRSRSGSPQ